MDPYATLGLSRGADAADALAAYRREVKRWHPDAGGGDTGARRTALLNEAYARVRADLARTPTAVEPVPSRPRDGAAEADVDLLALLGAELRAELEDGERVVLALATATWASPQTLLVVTDRRLLWLLDDAPVGRVRTLPLTGLRDVRLQAAGPLRRSARLRIRDRAGRRTTFTGLDLPAADALADALGRGRLAA